MSDSVNIRELNDLIASKSNFVGLITLENGIYLLGLLMTEGLPLVVELGVFLDVLIAVVVLVILTSRMRLSFMTTDTSVMKKLKG